MSSSIPKLTEGYEKKGGQNSAISKIPTRPAPPKPISTGASSSSSKPTCEGKIVEINGKKYKLMGV